MAVKGTKAGVTWSANGLTINFDGAGKSVLGKIPGAINRFTDVFWEFGDGTQLAKKAPTTDAAWRPSHTYAAAGSFNAILWVKDSAGWADPKYFTVKAVAPADALRWFTFAAAPEPLRMNFAGQQGTAPGISATAAPPLALPIRRTSTPRPATTP